MPGADVMSSSHRDMLFLADCSGAEGLLSGVPHMPSRHLLIGLGFKVYRTDRDLGHDAWYIGL